MAPDDSRVERRRWVSVFQRAPLGVLVLGFLLLLVGAAFVLGGILFIFSGHARNWPIWLVILVAGPLCVYLALNLLYLKRWAWITTVTLLALLFASSGVRAATGEGLPIAPLAEMTVFLGVLLYLNRSSVRQVFGWK